MSQLLIDSRWFQVSRYRSLVNPTAPFSPSGRAGSYRTAPFIISPFHGLSDFPQPVRGGGTDYADQYSIRIKRAFLARSLPLHYSFMTRCRNRWWITNPSSSNNLYGHDNPAKCELKRTSLYLLFFASPSVRPILPLRSGFFLLCGAVLENKWQSVRNY